MTRSLSQKRAAEPGPHPAEIARLKARIAELEAALAFAAVETPALAREIDCLRFVLADRGATWALSLYELLSAYATALQRGVLARGTEPAE